MIGQKDSFCLTQYICLNNGENQFTCLFFPNDAGQIDVLACQFANEPELSVEGF